MIPRNISEELKQNSYPGRGIILGRSEDGKCAVLIYFIMGRSENSRNRIFVETDDGIRIEAFDSSKMTDPSLIIYHPVRIYNGHIIVTNGDQTETIKDNMLADNSFHSSLLKREFEPDSPNYTPRISGLIRPDASYELSIIKSLDGDPSCCCRQFFAYDAPKAGLGHFIHTYQSDGNPLPSFEGEPKPIAVTGSFPDIVQTVWDSLNADNKISLYAFSRDIATGASEHILFNKNGEV